MARVSEQVEWLSLVDTSGPFIAATVLEDVFPQGLEKIETPRRQRLRAAYDEWRDAVDEDDPELAELHAAWIRMVLQEALEYEDEVLIPRDRLGGRLAYRAPEHGVEIAPDFAVQGDDGRPRLLIAVHPPETDLEKPLPGDRWPVSPLERMTVLCRANDVRVGLVTDGERWTVVNAPVGGTSGYATWLARLWWQEPVTFRAFVSLLGVRRCFGAEDQRLDRLLEKSIAFQEEVTDTLGEQVRRAVEVLIQALGRADQDRNGELLKDVGPAELYEAGLTVMMRLVFLLCAEERGLLLLGEPLYDQCYAISTLRAALREAESLHGSEVLERRYDAWSRMLAVFRAVYGGIEHETLRLPALGGSLFDPDRFPFLEGRPKGTSWRDATADPLPIDNRTVLLLLTALQVLEHRGGAQLLSYRALDVEQIGHVYEGLLEYTVAKVPDVTLGLAGSKKIRHPSIALAELESLRSRGIETAVERLAELTGRSASAVRNALERGGDDAAFVALVQACGGDEALARRLLPFASLIRPDSWGRPLVYRAGSFAVTPGADRRETGTHYTPRSLTETIVEKTLEPIVYEGPAEGRPREQWRLKPPAELLDLKICDPAMGSGAFLVQACRYLSERLVEAWGREEDAGRFVTVDGAVVDAAESHERLPKDTDERLLIARRLVAERCLYGVDLNPLAVELAKLSIWLTTMAKGRPFAFLDHNLRCGDSLLGIHRLDQLTKLTMDPDRPEHQLRLFGRNIEDAVRRTIKLRMRLRQIRIRDIHDVEAMARLDEESRDVLEHPSLIADAFVAEVLRSNGSESAGDGTLDLLAMKADRVLGGDEKETRQLGETTRCALAEGLPRGKPVRRPFHWPLEFPEVFARDNPGFDAVIGNPPFLGNRLWKPILGERMQWQARMIVGAKAGKVDLCILFHRRAAELIRSEGGYGLLATTNIAEGSAIDVGLGEIVRRGNIIFARKGLAWPGTAAVIVALVCFYKGQYRGPKDADGSECRHIGPRLVEESQDQWAPKPLRDGLFSFEGVNNSKGMAFVIGEDHPWFERLRSEPDSLLRPYVTGDDITTHALQAMRRWALDICDRSLEEIQRKYPVAYRFLDEVVKPTRTARALKSYKGLIDRWWQFWNHRADLMRRVREHDEFIAFSKVTKHPICMLAPSGWIYTNKVVLIGFERPDLLPICLSSVFRSWVEKYSGAGLGMTFQLSVRESLDTFPLPEGSVSERGIALAACFNERAIEWSQSNGLGLTELMNAIHRPENGDGRIAELRECLQHIDAEVMEAYGWSDLDAAFDFREIEGLQANDRWRFCLRDDVRTELICRLLKLNRERCEAADA
jgi:hypothetical protein